MNAITPCLWFDTEGEAAEFYTSVFPNSKIDIALRSAGPRRGNGHDGALRAERAAVHRSQRRSRFHVQRSHLLE